MTKKSFSLEEAFKRMEEILKELESGEKDLEESIQLYEEGIKLANQCKKHLVDLEKRVKIINSEIEEKENGKFDI